MIENVPLLRSRGLSKVLQDLDSIGYHAEWDIIPAAAVGAPHLRERIWIIARPAEIASQPVYGESTGNPFGFLGKLQRAGRMGETLEELVPIAPRKTKRQDGWSYWAGVNLLGDEGTHLWRTPNSSLIEVKSSVTKLSGRTPQDPQVGLADQVNAVERGAVLLPTPSARSYGNNQGGAAGRVGPIRHSLQSMALHNLWPTPKATDADRGGRGDLIQVVRGNTSPIGHYGLRPLLPTATVGDSRSSESRVGNPDTKAHPGFTLTDIIMRKLLPTPNARDWKDSGPTQGNRKSPNLGTIAHLWPSPTASDGMGGPGTSPKRTGGENLRTADSGPKKGSLNPTWVEWLMGLPLWWTDPTVHSTFCTQVGWDSEPLHVSPRTSSDINLRVPRLKACGNSVVWQCAYFALARAIAATPQVGAQAALEVA